MFLERFYENMRQNPQKIAVQQGEHTLSYQQLWQEACSLAAFLQEEGRSPVLVYGHKHPRMIISLLACLLCGRPWVPCDHSLPIGRMAEIARLCKAELLLLPEEAPQPLSLQKVKTMTWEDIPNSLTWTPPAYHKVTVAYIMFTSGTTGQPKGIPISIGNVENFAAWLLSHQELAAPAQRVVVNQANLSFDLSVADWCAALLSGGTLLLTTKEEQFQLGRFFQQVRQHQGALLVCTPTFLRLCLCDRSFCAHSLPSLQAVFLCGEPLSVPTAAQMKQRFPSLSLFNAYGPTEATCAVCGLLIQPQHLSQQQLPVGDLSHAAVTITLKDGEIYLDGDSVFKGYVGQPPLQGPYPSGDLGFIENGLLYCSGRRDSQIKYLGYRIDLEEIRQVLEKLPGIQQAVVTAQRDANGTVRRLAAYITPSLDGEVLRLQLREKLPSYMVPSLFLPMEQLPLSSNTKAITR